MLNLPCLKPYRVLLNWVLLTHDYLHACCNFYPAAILPKSTNTKHINENVEVFSFSLTTEDMTTLDNLNKDTHLCWNPEDVAWKCFTNSKIFVKIYWKVFCNNYILVFCTICWFSLKRYWLINRIDKSCMHGVLFYSHAYS
jgi:hypothetical protein